MVGFHKPFRLPDGIDLREEQGQEVPGLRAPVLGGRDEVDVVEQDDGGSVLSRQVEDLLDRRAAVPTNGQEGRPIDRLDRDPELVRGGPHQIRLPAPGRAKQEDAP